MLKDLIFWHTDDCFILRKAEKKRMLDATLFLATTERLDHWPDRLDISINNLKIFSAEVLSIRNT
ncbi:hypothetical protein DRF67_12920 [Chryseobacterium pennipullorum]|uniref:Uncharacterized protein n=1 Tax=Chryseobacterium pennipullorum TaxID=2258963 RepID=A0A3D9AZE1_9FLAO|nr:hypothetical protein DRF67_12920 [Chryseobacterium pennipullorum]